MLTQVEIVLLSVAEQEKETDKVCKSYVLKLSANLYFIDPNTDIDVRAADAFLPKYRFRYHAIGPAPEGSGAGPRGSRS